MTGSKPSLRCKISILAAMTVGVLVVATAPSSWFFSRSHQASPPPVETFHLKNGMEVVLLEDKRVPAVTHMLWYKVGAADDFPGRSGLAHYNEHMMFQGTESTQSGEFLQKITANGGRANAFTSRDYTAYYVSIAKEHLPMVMQMEADRMVHLAPSQEHFSKEREVIIEERRMSVENQPAALLSEEMQAMLFLNHPYRIPVIGWMHEMQSLSREDVLAFHQQFYHPANAILVVVGDVSRKELEPLAEKYYGTLPAGEPYVRHWNSEPPQRGARRTTMRHVNVREPELVRLYTAPSVNSPQKEMVLPGLLLAQILGGSTSSRMYQSLVVRQKLATSVDVNYDGFSVGMGELEIHAQPAEGVTLEQLEAAVDKELAQVEETPLSAEELARAKTLLKSETIYARDGIEGMARTLGMLVAEGLSPSYFFTWPEAIDQISAARVQKTASPLFDINHSVTGYLLPQIPAQKGTQP